MPKYKIKNFMQVNREAFHNDCDLNWRAKWLYVVLTELEHRYTGKNKDYFFRSQSDLEKDTGMHIDTNRKYRKELVEKGWLETWKMHYKDEKTGRLSRIYVTGFRVLK